MQQKGAHGASLRVVCGRPRHRWILPCRRKCSTRPPSYVTNLIWTPLDRTQSVALCYVSAYAHPGEKMGTGRGKDERGHTGVLSGMSVTGGCSGTQA